MNRYFRKNGVSILLIILGIIFILIGYFRGEVQIVLMKAIAICLECVGIG